LDTLTLLIIQAQEKHKKASEEGEGQRKKVYGLILSHTCEEGRLGFAASRSKFSNSWKRIKIIGRRA